MWFKLLLFPNLRIIKALISMKQSLLVQLLLRIVRRKRNHNSNSIPRKHELLKKMSLSNNTLIVKSWNKSFIIPQISMFHWRRWAKVLRLRRIKNDLKTYFNWKLINFISLIQIKQIYLFINFNWGLISL